MDLPLTTPREPAQQTFLYSEPASDLDHLKADIAFLGIPFGDAYTFQEIVNDQTNMPAAMRQASNRIVRSLERYDSTSAGPLYDGRPIRTVDCGDVSAEPSDSRRITAAPKRRCARFLPQARCRSSSAATTAFPIPVLRALDREGPITLVQIDQHIDWRDHVNGVREGYSSPIRRASEMAHVGEIFQIGLRATGSARLEEVEAARAYGAHLITAYELHDVGMEAILARIPDGGRYYLTVDLDGMDPSIAPAVAGPCPGGVTFVQARKLIHGLVRKGRVLGMDVVEITPRDDVNRITCITAGRLIVNLIGAAVRAGYFDKP